MNEQDSLKLPTSWWQRIRPEYRDLARDLEEKCDWAWTTRHAAIDEEDLTDYKIFLLCKRMANDITVQAGRERLFLSPTAEIDAVWHKHMLRPQCYMPMCDVLLAGLDRKAHELLEYCSDADDSAESKLDRIAAMVEYKRFLVMPDGDASSVVSTFTQTPVNSQANATQPSSNQVNCSNDSRQTLPAASQMQAAAAINPTTPSTAAPPASSAHIAACVATLMPAGGDAAILLRVADWMAGAEVGIRMMRSMPMWMLMMTFAERIGWSMRELRFKHNGVRLKEDETPEMLSMRDDDRVEVVPKRGGW